MRYFANDLDPPNWLLLKFSLEKLLFIPFICGQITTPCRTLKITLIQSDLHWEDAEANLSMFEEKIWQINGAYRCDRVA